MINRMLRRRLLAGATLCIAVFGRAAVAQTDPQTPPKAAEDRAEEIVVTGSIIRGSSEQAALPVDVIDHKELEQRGSPSLLDLLKNQPGVSGILGDANQLDGRAGQGTEGTGTINLRGLGPERTLVLLNGRRLAINPFALAGAGAVDTSMIPLDALDRVEILKDGAATTYGTDAVAGVVNFITRKNFTGLRLGGSYRYIDGSDGDYTLSAVGGWKTDRLNLLVSAGWQHRSELPLRERDFAFRPYLENPNGGYSGAGNPGSIFTASGLRLRDPQCAALGNFPGFAGPAQSCILHNVDFYSLVDKEDHLQVYGQVDYDISDSHRFHLDALYGSTSVPHVRSSTSFPLISSPTAEVAANASVVGRYFIPPTAPGLIDLVAKNVGSNPALADLAVNGAFLNPLTFRPYGVGGNPLFDNKSIPLSRKYDAFRISGGFEGDLSSTLHYDANVTFGQEKGTRDFTDILVNRFASALRGLGGPNCNFAANTPGANGCLYFNPFSNGVQANVLTGQTNPQYNPAVANNSTELARWLSDKGIIDSRTRVFTASAVISGKAPVSLPGGEIAFAVGAEYRKNWFKVGVNDIANINVTPCRNTPDFGVTNCPAAARVGPFVFNGTYSPLDLTNDVRALYGELQLPILRTLTAVVAARFEDYGKETGSTFDPKVSLKWQVFPAIALRGSYSKTFRAPPLTSLAPGATTSLSNIFGTFRAVDIVGSPTLKPETAATYNAGVVVTSGSLRASLDYWGIDLKDQIVVEGVAGPVNILFPNGLNGSDNCNNPAFASLRAQFTFVSACSAGGIARVSLPYINGPTWKSSGLDLMAQFDFPDQVMGGKLQIGGTATYVLRSKIGPTTVSSITVDPGFDAVGKLNYQTTAYPLPRVKGQAYFQYDNGPHSLHATLNYIGGYTDQRPSLFAVGAFRDANGTPVTVPGGQNVKSFTTVDLTYRVEVMRDTSITLTVNNLLGTAPPFARLDFNYDPFTASGLLRTVKLSVIKSF